MQQPNIILGALRPENYLNLVNLLFHALIIIMHHNMPCYVLSNGD